MTRLAGHSLVHEGAAHDEEGQRIRQHWSVNAAGVGRGKCSCGALSDVLPSGGQRKAWHKAHKEELLEDEPAVRAAHFPKLLRQVGADEWAQPRVRSVNWHNATAAPPPTDFQPGDTLNGRNPIFVLVGVDDAGKRVEVGRFPSPGHAANARDALREGDLDMDMHYVIEVDV